MKKISRQEVLAIAKMSRIALREDEIHPMIEQLEQVLSYAQRVSECVMTRQELPLSQVNVFRKDVVIPQDPEPLLARAPEREGNYFVVPAILEL